MRSSFAAVDLGATSGRVVLGTFSHTGAAPTAFQLDEVHRFPNNPMTIEGELCWDVENLFEQTLIGLSLAFSCAQDNNSTLSGIAVDSWGVDYGLVDESLNLVAPVRHYRAAEEVYVHRANMLVSPREAYARTGITELPINTCFQLIRDCQQGLLTQGVAALLIPDLWTAWLTGVRGTEQTIASTTGLLDWESHDWAYDLVHQWGIPESVLTEVVETGSMAGRTLAPITERIGAVNPIPVYRAPAHDTASAFAAVTSPDTDAAVVSCGTWALVGCLNPEPVLAHNAEQAGLTNEVAADGSALLVRNLSGTWLLEECLRAWSSHDSSVQPKDIEALRFDLLAAAESESAQVLGTIDCGAPQLIGTRDMPAEILALYQQTHGDAHGPLELGRHQIVRLILESLAESFARTISNIGEIAHRNFREVIMIGGGSRINQLVGLTEHATGLSVQIKHQEATSIGNICVQAVSAGIFDSIDQARAATNTNGN